MTTFSIHIEELKNRFSDLNETQFTNLILDKFRDIDFCLGNLLPHNRKKRWNTIGTIWKFIAGSPDAEDLKIINSSINNLVSNNNEQIKINRQLTLQMKNAIFKTRDALNLYNSRANDLYSLNIFHNLKYLHEKLEQVMETVMLARVGILNENVLNKSEMEILLRDLSKEGITVHTAAEAIKYVTTSIATNGKEIALLIKVPKLDDRKLRKIYVHPVLYEGQQIYVTAHNYLTHGKQVYRVNNIESTIFEESSIHWDNTSCLPNLIRGEPATCDYVSNIAEEIIRIDETHLLVSCHGNFTFSSDCGLTNRTLQGSYLISFTNCNIFLKNQSYSNKLTHLRGSQIQLHIDGVVVQKAKSMVKLSLDHLHNLHLETRKELDFIRLKTESIQFPHWTFIGGLTTIYFVIGLAIFLSFFFRRKSVAKVHEVKSKEEEATTSTQDLPFEDIRTEPHF